MGENNTGKISLLEAIHIMEYPGEIGHYINVCRQREGKGKISPYNIFENSISRDNSKATKEVEISAKIKNNDVGSLIRVESVDVVKMLPTNSEVKAFEINPRFWLYEVSEQRWRNIQRWI